MSLVFENVEPRCKNWPFRDKNINFLILAKFRVYPILNVLISNLTLVFENFEPKSPNTGNFCQKRSVF